MADGCLQITAIRLVSIISFVAQNVFRYQTLTASNHLTKSATNPHASWSGVCLLFPGLINTKLGKSRWNAAMHRRSKPGCLQSTITRHEPAMADVIQQILHRSPTFSIPDGTLS